MWYDKGRPIPSLYWVGGTINRLKVYFFVIHIVKVPEKMKNDYVFYLDNHMTKIENGGQVLEFLQWMYDNKIKFWLSWRWNGHGLWPNFKTLLYIIHLNIEMLQIVFYIKKFCVMAYYKTLLFFLDLWNMIGEVASGS